MVMKIHKAKESIHKTIVLLLLSIATFKHEIFNINHNGGGNQTTNIIFLIVLIIFFVILERATETKLDSYYLFRWKIMGSDNIEGVWMDIVRNNCAIRCGAILTIQYIDGEYIVTGDEYFEDGTAGGTFNTENSTYNNRRLDFTHCSRHENGETVFCGRGHYDFKGFKCMQFIGDFIHDHDDRHFEVRGVRLSSVLHEIPQDDIKGISSSVIHYYKKGIRRKISRIFTQRPSMTPVEKKILTIAMIKYYKRSLQCDVAKGS